MAYYLLDTSALVKYYHLEIGSPTVIALVDDPTHFCFISHISLAEMHSAFARRVRAGEITAAQFRQWQRRFFGISGPRSSGSSDSHLFMSGKRFVC